MSAQKSRTLPSVLSEYSVEYETPTGSMASAGAQRTIVTRRDNRRSRPVTRERSSDIIRQQLQKEKHQKHFDNWQQAKQDFRDEETQKLRRKIQLQQELIRKQDELWQVKQEEERERVSQSRQEDRESRQAQRDELRQICLASLEADRRGPTDSRSTSQLSESKRSSETPPLRLPTYITDTSSVQPAPYVVPLTPPQSSEEEEEDWQLKEEDDTRPLMRRQSTRMQVVVEDQEELPWHHLQLYELYGSKADYFLYPKMQPEKKTVTKPLNPRLRKTAASMGAGELWGCLRNESHKKLTDEDRCIPGELKQAYSAFVRESIATTKKPVQRNYLETEDVPDMDRLIDQSKVKATQKYRHKVEVMFRSSTMNEDKCNVLMYNNPLPDLNNWQGEDSVERYVPTWADKLQEEDEAEKSYNKWLKDDCAPITPQSSHSLPALRRPSPPTAQTTMVFLTEEAATVPGEFTQRRKAALEAKHLPPGQLASSQPSMSRTASVPSSSSSSRSGWQPLSLSALQEYSDKRRGLGHGHFAHGRPAIWSMQA